MAFRLWVRHEIHAYLVSADTASERPMDQPFGEYQDGAGRRLQRYLANLVRSHSEWAKVLTLVYSAERREQIGAVPPMGAGYDAEVSAISA